MKLTTIQKILLVFFFFGIAIAGFMVRLPSTFRHHDKVLHAAFYFLAAAFLNLLFARKNTGWHILIFLLLYGMGIAIEYAQEYSNTFLHKKIHGRYDPEDVEWNLKGLLAFSAVWIPVVLMMLSQKIGAPKKV